VRIPFTQHLGTKVMALVLGVILWGFSYMESFQDTQLKITLTVTPPEGWRLTKAPDEVTVRVQGPRRRIETINVNPNLYVVKSIKASALDSDSDDQKVTIPIRKDDLGLIGRDNTLIIADLPREEVQISREGRRLLPVIPRIEGKPAPGYDISEKRVIPATVEVTGPKSLIESTDAAIYTDLVQIEGMSTRFQLPVPIDARMSDQRVDVSAKTVTVIVDFQNRPETKAFEKIPVTLGIPPNGYPYRVTIVDNPSVKVTVEGPGQTLGLLDSSQIIVLAPVSPDYKPSQSVPYTATLTVVVPQGFTATAYPSTVALTVTAP
jgi:YbbR domain-containing protein